MMSKLSKKTYLWRLKGYYKHLYILQGELHIYVGTYKNNKLLFKYKHLTVIANIIHIVLAAVPRLSSHPGNT